ncbi:MAG: hypothetical protein IPL53_08065 [Ignavibacteria bacterium]|nr:hypothetical protein [Ignavibacteria bacterium]
MIENLPNSIVNIFILTTFLTAYLFFKASGNSYIPVFIMFIWLFIQSAVGHSEYYTVTNSMPPRFTLLVLPPLILIVMLFITKKGREFTDSLDLKMMTYLQTVRLPVEITLYMLFQSGYIPELMTFEGRNFDILAGLTAPFVAYFGFTKKVISRKVILIWNIICLGLVLNIVINAVLSAPFPFQKFAFDQPNVAVLYFPFVLLPGFIVPVVVLCHLASIRQLTVKNDKQI